MIRTARGLVLFVSSVSLLGAWGCAPAAVVRTQAPVANGAAAEPIVEAAAIGPLTAETPLQVVSIFAYESGEALISPATEVAGFVAPARTRESFGREPLRTMLLDPAPASIKARRLLYVALGSRAEFSLPLVKQIGHAAMRETLRLGVEDMAFAPVVRDQGVTTYSADQVAAAFVEGALGEFLDERRAHPEATPALRHVTYEAGPAFVDAVRLAVSRGVDAAHAAARQ